MMLWYFNDSPGAIMNAHIAIQAAEVDQAYRFEIKPSVDEEFVGFDYVDIDGIKLLNTAAALVEHAKNVATPHKFEIGDLVDLHFTRRGHFDAIVLDRHLFGPGASGGRAVTLLFVDDGPLAMTVSETSLKLIERGYWTEEEVTSYLTTRRG